MTKDEGTNAKRSETQSATSTSVTHVHCFHCYREFKVAALPTRTCECGRTVEDGELPTLRRKPVGEKKPPSLKATLIVLGVLFLCLYPGVRWRFAEFNLWVRSSLPFGGNPFIEKPGGLRPEMIVIEARFGANSELMSGKYYLLQATVHGRSTWFKNAPGQEAYLVWDACGAWLISRYPDGRAPKCEGWAYTHRCYGLPWECFKTWHIREDGRWENAGSSVTVTPVYGQVSKSVAPLCSSEDEQFLIEKFGDFDIVIPWINGSDPTWLSERGKVCVDWQWTEMWPDAVSRSIGVNRCLAEEASVEEANKLLANGKCSKGALGREGACVWPKGKKAPRGLTTKSSICFRRFVDNHCTGRLNTIKDHDELRYLIRSLEQNLPWHRGNIFLITSMKTVPTWIKEGGRLRVIAQEDLFQNAMSSPTYVSSSDRNRLQEWAPDQIFNDYPVQAALPFIPNASRILMQLQDDLFFARLTSICEFFSVNPVALKLFARPYEALQSKDAYSQVYESMELWSAKRFSEFSKKKDGVASSYYRDLHLPHMLDLGILEDMWRDFPEVMSDSISSAFRHPNLTNIIAFHHSEAARRANEMQLFKDTDREETESLEYQVTNLVMNLSGKIPVSRRPWMEVVFESVNDWHERMAKIPPNASKLPAMIGLQDNFAGDIQHLIPELDCLREKWLTKLFPAASSFEDPDKPPNLCSSLQHSPIMEPPKKTAKKEKTEL